MNTKCKYYHPIVEIEPRVVGETEYGEPIVVPEQVLVAEFCEDKNDYITTCKGCKFHKEIE